MGVIAASQAPAGIQGILLAAGKGRRFGADKLLHPLADGTPMALQSARHMRAALPRMLVVLRPDSRALEELLRREGLPCVIATSAELGMGHSIAAGVAASADAAGWVMGLADMPFVLPETIASVAAALHDGAPLAAPQFQGQRGHPVGLGAGFRDALLALQGDAGARAILQNEAQRLRLVPVSDAGVLRDVDTPADLGGAPAHTAQAKTDF
ncbi:molybdenum cofactor cytidylyltransferase [Burkholderiales bacterium]|nr:molybdenum cofactor cytidylyltransferase [Burkholderiales bacterium]